MGGRKIEGDSQFISESSFGIGITFFDEKETQLKCRLSTAQYKVISTLKFLVDSGY